MVLPGVDSSLLVRRKVMVDPFGGLDGVLLRILEMVEVLGEEDGSCAEDGEEWWRTGEEEECGIDMIG